MNKATNFIRAMVAFALAGAHMYRPPSGSTEAAMAKGFNAPYSGRSRTQRRHIRAVMKHQRYRAYCQQLKG